jgi:hypothetical protein
MANEVREEDEMTRRIVRFAIVMLASVGLVGAPAAWADGLPTPGVVTPSGGVPGPGGTHYVTASERGATVVRELRGEHTVRTQSIAGRFTVPAVALDGSPTGLSADGGTLILIRPRSSFPQAQTHLMILDAHQLSVRRQLTLHGDFSFDAISPDGSTLYFIEYTSAHDPTRYAVRAYDVQAGRLLPEPIVDPDEHAGEMRGYPMTRTTSADGRWAYTLYDGGGKEPFVHALDTVRGRAVCIDLDELMKGSNLGRVAMTLGSDGNELTLASPKGTAAVIDTQTLEARDPSVPPPASADGGADGGGFPWMLVVVAMGVGLAGAGAIVVIRHRRESGMAAPDA